jgi:hypothetical protein
MKIGGRCPLSDVKNQEAFLKNEINNFYKTNIDSDIENMKRIFCRSICKNVMC